MRVKSKVIWVLSGLVMLFQDASAKIGIPGSACSTLSLRKRAEVVSTTKRIHPAALERALAVRGGENYLDMTVGWLINLGTPAALVRNLDSPQIKKVCPESSHVVSLLFQVGGAALANFFEMAPSLDLRAHDTASDKLIKQSVGLLLVSSFAMEVLVVFMTTVQVTNMLGTPPEEFESLTAMSLLHDHYEFEYVACRLFFLQGLLNWLGAIALALMRDDKDPQSIVATKRFKSAIGASIFGIMIMILAFFNHHLYFYKNYVEMTKRFFVLAFDRYFCNWPPRPLPLIAVIPFAYSVRLFFSAFLKSLSTTAKHEKRR